MEHTIDILSSLQRPRKIVVKASNGKSYAFLCKPKDDLRKDARLMEFDAMINNLLQSNSESRKRRLCGSSFRDASLLQAHTSNPLPCRHSHVLCRDVERRMRLYRMGPKHDWFTTHPQSTLSCSRDSSLCACRACCKVCHEAVQLIVLYLTDSANQSRLGCSAYKSEASR